MLTLQLQQSAASARTRPRSMSTSALRSSTSTLVRPGTASIQSRSLWWKRACDYNSQIDPMYHRMSRHRTLKTRTKLLDKLRRRCRWDWDLARRPFFAPKHIRWASHFSRPKSSPEQEKQSPKSSDEADGFELSQREKVWKEHMEALRKRLHQDPYEAVFGRRFEPFWSPLVPSWMKEEIGLKDWSKPKESSEAQATAHTTVAVNAQKVDPAKALYIPLEPEPIKAKSQVDPNSGASEAHTAPARYTYDPKMTSVDMNTDTPDGQQTSYSYASATSWDSWTKKASRVEWDPTSGEKRRFEYDPISNRMLQVNGPPESVTKKQDMLKYYPAKSQPHPVSHDRQSGLGNKPAVAVDIPVTTFKDTRQAISVLTQDSTGRKTSVYFPSLINTSVVADNPKPASLTKHEDYPASLTKHQRAPGTLTKHERHPDSLINHQMYPDSLTADDVRASVGQRKVKRIAAQVQDVTCQDHVYRDGKPDPRKMSEWDQAEHRVMLKQELYDITKQKQKLLRQEVGSFHIERIHRELAKLEVRAAEVHSELDAIDAVKPAAAKRLPERLPTEQMGCNDMVTASLDTGKLSSRSKKDPPAQSSKATASPGLQSAVERMSAKHAPFEEEPDDSAAHESTGDFGDYKAGASSQNWENQAVLFQVDRVRRIRELQDARAHAENDTLRKSGTSMVEVLREKRSLEDRVQGDVLGRKSAPRWVDVMNTRKAAYETRKAEEHAVVEVRDAGKTAKLAKANALLQAEIDQQKTRMNAHEFRHAFTAADPQVPAPATTRERADASESKRYQEKIKELRKELDIAYKQSSANAEGLVDTIRKLEKKLETSLERQLEATDAEKRKYIKKIKALREVLDTAFKQSSINAEMQTDRIRGLQKELESARQPSKSTEFVQAEGDMSTSVTKFAKDSSKWYKQEANVHEKDVEELEHELNSRNGARDEELLQHELRAGSAYKQQDQRSEQAVIEVPRPETHPIDSALAEYEGRMAQRKRDQALVNEVRDIYENEYGTIDVNHRQQSVDNALEAYEKQKGFHVKLATQVVEVETDVDLGKALADYEKEQKYEFQRDNLEAEIAHQEKEAHEALSFMDKEVHGTRRVDVNVQHPIHAQTKHNLQWEEPPVYKILAYDSGNDFLVTSTTSTNFTGMETPISIPEALSQLYQPARFIPEFSELQQQGFQVIHGTKDLLVFRKAKSPGPVLTTPPSTTTTLHDHGLFSTSSSQSAEPTSVNSAPKINPIDKTGYQETETGSFASPTGFVGDRWENDGTPHKHPSTTSHEPRTSDSAHQTKSYPRITRQEQVFSGSRLRPPPPPPSSSSPHSSSFQDQSSDDSQQKSHTNSWAHTAAKWTLLSGVGASVIAYGIGAAAEKSRERDAERWQRILAEQRGLGGFGSDGRRLGLQQQEQQRQGGSGSGSGVFWR